MYHQLNGLEFEQLREIVKDRGAWRAAIHGVAKRQINLRLNNNDKIFLNLQYNLIQ